MFIDIIPLQKNTAHLTRVYGDAPCAALPASVPGPEGGVLAITELGDYCFSEKPRSLPGADALCRYEVSPDGTCTLVQAFGRDLTGRHGRYDLDFGEGAAAPEELHPVCGNFVEEVILPGSLQVIGSCAFYNCRRLRRLSVGAGELTVGSDVFLNCFALADLLVRAAPEEKTGLFALVNNITEAVKRFPGLGEIPVLGALARSTEFQTDQTELMFIITPRLVQALAEAPRVPTDNHVVPSRAEVYLNGALESSKPAPAAKTAPAAAMPSGTATPAPAPAPVAAPQELQPQAPAEPSVDRPAPLNPPT